MVQFSTSGSDWHPVDNLEVASNFAVTNAVSNEYSCPFGRRAEKAGWCVRVSACQCAGVVTARVRVTASGESGCVLRTPLAESWGLKRKRKPGESVRTREGWRCWRSERASLEFRGRLRWSLQKKPPSPAGLVAPRARGTRCPGALVGCPGRCPGPGVKSAGLPPGHCVVPRACILPRDGTSCHTGPPVGLGSLHEAHRGVQRGWRRPGAVQSFLAAPEAPEAPGVGRSCAGHRGPSQARALFSSRGAPTEDAGEKDLKEVACRVWNLEK